MFSKLSRVFRMGSRMMSEHQSDPRKLRQLNQKVTSKYMIDTNETAHVVIKTIALHGKIKNPSAIQLSSTFEELGLNVLDVTEIGLMIEEEFNIEFPDELMELVKTPQDIAELVAKNWFSLLS
jgi:acyl carrier protein